MTATSSPGEHAELDAAQRVHRGLAAAVHARRLAQLEHELGHRTLSRSRSSRTARGRGRRASRRRRDLAVVEPAHLGLGGEDHRFEDQQPRGVALLVGARLELRELLQRAQRGGALGLHDGWDVDAGRRDRERELDGQLVPRAPAALDGRGEPPRHLAPALVGDAVRRAAVTVGLADGLDQAVAFEPPERRVDLADVQRPGRAGGGVELRSQLVAVHRAPLQQGEKTVPNRHAYRVCILRMLSQGATARLRVCAP